MTNIAENLFSVACIAAVLWLAGFLAHAGYVDDNYRTPAREELMRLQILKNDPVAEKKAEHKIEVAECRRGDMLWFLPVPDKCGEWEKHLSQYDAAATPASVKRDRQMIDQAILRSTR